MKIYSVMLLVLFFNWAYGQTFFSATVVNSKSNEPQEYLNIQIPNETKTKRPLPWSQIEVFADTTIITDQNGYWSFISPEKSETLTISISSYGSSYLGCFTLNKGHSTIKLSEEEDFLTKKPIEIRKGKFANEYIYSRKEFDLQPFKWNNWVKWRSGVSYQLPKDSIWKYLNIKYCSLVPQFKKLYQTDSDTLEIVNEVFGKLTAEVLIYLQTKGIENNCLKIADHDGQLITKIIRIESAWFGNRRMRGACGGGVFYYLPGDKRSLFGINQLVC